MADIMVIIIFGWPAVITSILFSIAGLHLKRPKLLMAAGIMIIPFIYYISNGFRNPALSLPLLQFASAYAITRQMNVTASLLITPLIIVSAAFAYAVLTQ